ncbi:class I SAM-dependent methyltransferase [Candidatus Roizmanbacteria bacterium]|nr:class I SAM-dependent methyltransferase [Candidatus Roizmanbacteria bacterium]
MTLEHRYAISLLVQRPGKTPADNRILLSLRDPQFHKDLGDVWGLASSRYLTHDDFETLTAPESVKTKPILQRVENDIAAIKFDGKVQIHIQNYVAHDSDIRVDSKEPNSPNFVLHMVVFTANVEGELPSSTSAYKQFQFLTVADYKALRIKEAEIGKQCGMCTNIMLHQDILRETEEKYRDEADRECREGKMDVFKNMWESPDMIRFFAGLPADELTKSLGTKVDNFTYGKGRILIVGGAVGRLGRHVAQNYPDLKVMEVDLSPLMVQTAKTTASRDKIRNFHTINGNAFSLPFDGKVFDLVVSQGFLRHFPQSESYQLVEEMRRVGKRILVAEANSGGGVVVNLANQYETPIKQETMMMPRISLFAHLYHRYGADNKFKEFIDQTIKDKRHHYPDIDVVSYLAQLARSEKGTLYYFGI